MKTRRCASTGQMLHNLGHQVVAVAENGESLISLCAKTNPDVLITGMRAWLGDGRGKGRTARSVQRAGISNRAGRRPRIAGEYSGASAAGVGQFFEGESIPRAAYWRPTIKRTIVERTIFNWRGIVFQNVCLFLTSCERGTAQTRSERKERREARAR